MQLPFYENEHGWTKWFHALCRPEMMSPWVSLYGTKHTSGLSTCFSALGEHSASVAFLLFAPEAAEPSAFSTAALWADPQ